MFTQNELFEQIQDIIFSVLKSRRENFEEVSAEKLEMQTNLYSDLNMDSIEVLTAITAIEDAFDIEFLDEDMDMDKMAILGNIVEGLQRALNNKASE